MMTAVKDHWITALAVLGVLFLWFIVIGATVVGAFFWLFLRPMAIALPVLYFGVIRRGLERELRPI